MAIGPIELNNSMTRLQDFTTQKHNEEVKGVVDQGNFQSQFKKEIDDRLNQVHHTDEAQNGESKFDAKEKGHGSYEGDGGKNRKKGSSMPEGRVVPKGQGGFDIKI